VATLLDFGGDPNHQVAARVMAEVCALSALLGIINIVMIMIMMMTITIFSLLIFCYFY